MPYENPGKSEGGALPGTDKNAWRPSAHWEPLNPAPLDEPRTRAWSLVLESRRIPHQSRPLAAGWQIWVPARLKAQAAEELLRFEEENLHWPPPPPDAPELADNGMATVSVLLLLAIFHNLTLDPGISEHFRSEWLRLGEADAGKILSGEWWRLVTALTLHADGLHLLGNLLIGGIVVIRLCRQLGSGLGWSLLLLSGVAGNLVNALVQDHSHRAVGASTAVFGAIALLAGINLVHHRLRPLRRWPLPLAAAAALLALLGTGGERTDLGAHLFGFLAGLLLGLAAGILLARMGRPSPGLNALLALLCAMIPLLCWVMALTTNG